MSQNHHTSFSSASQPHVMSAGGGYTATAQSNAHVTSQANYAPSQQQQHNTSANFSYGFNTMPSSYTPSQATHDPKSQQFTSYASQTLPPQPQQQLAVHPHPSYSVPSTSEASKFSEVVIHEPDLSKRPQRSAMKGGKSKEMFQKQLEQKLQSRTSLTLQRDDPNTGSQWETGAGDPPKPRPRIGPKPVVRIHDKENVRPQSESSDDEEINWRDEESKYSCTSVSSRVLTLKVLTCCCRHSGGEGSASGQSCALPQPTTAAEGVDRTQHSSDGKRPRPQRTSTTYRLQTQQVRMMPLPHPPFSIVNCTSRFVSFSGG